VFLDSPCALPSVCRFSLVVVVVSGCRRCLTQAPASHLHSLPARTAHRIPPLLGCRCRRPTSLTTQCSLSSPALSQRLVHRTHSTHRIVRVATARPRISSSSQQPASSHHCNGVVQTHLRQHYSIPFALRQPALLACCCSSCCTQARGALQCPPSAAALAACPPVCHRTLQASACALLQTPPTTASLLPCPDLPRPRAWLPFATHSLTSHTPVQHPSHPHSHPPQPRRPRASPRPLARSFGPASSQKRYVHAAPFPLPHTTSPARPFRA